MQPAFLAFSVGVSFNSGPVQWHPIHMRKSTLTPRLKNDNQLQLYADNANL